MFRGVQVVVSGMALTMCVLAGARVAHAQEPEKPVLPLEGDAVVITMLIKADKTADFESVVAKYRESFQKNETKPVRKQQLGGIKFFKSPQMAQGNAVYIIYVDPVIPNEEYDISRVIAEVFPVEVQEIFEKYKGAFAGRAITSLKKVP
ncbi:MAG: hypothetical protein OEW19_01455 [Acidobacteriota bacterium]|nr:hypothetical protein [Acidobacteriota bacterium]